jgi:hypothetical protein
MHYWLLFRWQLNDYLQKLYCLLRIYYLCYLQPTIRLAAASFPNLWLELLVSLFSLLIF